MPITMYYAINKKTAYVQHGKHVKVVNATLLLHDFWKNLEIAARRVKLKDLRKYCW